MLVPSKPPDPTQQHAPRITRLCYHMKRLSDVRDDVCRQSAAGRSGERRSLAETRGEERRRSPLRDAEVINAGLVPPTRQVLLESSLPQSMKKSSKEMGGKFCVKQGKERKKDREKE